MSVMMKAAGLGALMLAASTLVPLAAQAQAVTKADGSYEYPKAQYKNSTEHYEALKRASAKVPTVLAIFLDRPAILTNIQSKAAAILANYGATDAAVLDVVMGKATAKGRLPAELPRSMAAVEAQNPAVPDDSSNPLYPRGAGIGAK